MSSFGLMLCSVSWILEAERHEELVAADVVELVEELLHLGQPGLPTATKAGLP